MRKIEFTPAAPDRIEQLKQALHRNADGASLLTDPRTTEFAGSVDADDLTDREVINAIKSVPCHY